MNFIPVGNWRYRKYTNENTLEEAYNSAMALADAISSVIGA